MAHSVGKSKEMTAHNRKKISGFTLIELITVIVILSILAVIGSSFVARTAETYQRTQARALLVNTARPALERMTRQLRIALPFSVRLANGGSCIEFMPIVSAGNYFDSVPDESNDPGNTAPLNKRQNIAASSPLANNGVPRFVAIGAMVDTELYGSGASITGYNGYNNATQSLQLNPAKRWRRNSINKRYYLLDNPQAFCVVNNQLRFYEGLNVTDSAVPLTGSSSIVARNINTTNAPFAISAGNGNRNIAIDIVLSFSSGGESITYKQRVLIRNVP